MGVRDVHRSCREVLSAWVAPDPEQRQLQQHYLDHLDERPDGWSRECPGAHLTASTIVISPDRDRVLLTLHRKLGRWLQTGGHIEPTDPSLPEAALREAREESGLPDVRLGPLLLLSRHQVPCGPVRPCYHLDVQFLATADPQTAPVVSEESDDVSWFDAERPPVSDTSVVALIAAARARGPQR